MTTTYPFVTEDPMAYPAEYARLQASEPVSRVQLMTGETAWLLTRHADVRALLTDDRFVPWAPGLPPQENPEDGLLFTMSGPAHARIRRIAARALTPRRVERFRPRTREIADNLLKSRPDDLLDGFASPLALTVLVELLGIPSEVSARFDRWIRELGGVIAAPDMDQMARSANELGQYVAELIAAKRRQPGEDLLSALITTHDEDNTLLSEEELNRLAFAILLAGYVPPANSLALAILRLMRTGERDIDEHLRLDQGTAPDQTRVAVADAEIGGVRIRTGEFVVAALRAAHRDPAARGTHMAFGHGPHHCLGAALARMQLEEGMAALAEAGSPVLAVPYEELPWRPMFLSHLGPAVLPVTW